MAEEKKQQIREERKRPRDESKRPGHERRGRGKPGEEKKAAAVRFSQAFSARVEEVIGRTGTRGEAIQVRCKVLEGRDQNKILRRNVKGPIQKGDILMLRETEIEARRLSGKSR